MCIFLLRSKIRYLFQERFQIYSDVDLSLQMLIVFCFFFVLFFFVKWESQLKCAQLLKQYQYPHK